MKSTLLLATVSLLSLGSLQAETATLEGVHNCCKKCEKGIAEAVAKIDGATATAEKGTVTITAKDADSVKKATASLVANGYYGKGAEAPAVTDATVKTTSVGGVHLCCAKCVTAVENAVKSVKGVTTHTAEKGATSFNVEGEFSTKELASALNKAGFSGSLK